MYFLRPNLYTIYTSATARCIFLDPICTQFILELRLDFFSYLRYRYLLAKMIIFLTLLEPTKFLDRFLLKTKSKNFFFRWHFWLDALPYEVQNYHCRAQFERYIFEAPTIHTNVKTNNTKHITFFSLMPKTRTNVDAI